MEEPIDTNKNVSQPQPMAQSIPEPKTQGPIIHTYEDDLALAMNTTDASVVQEMLQSARDRELAEAQGKVVEHQRGWYTTGGIILLILALGAAAYGIYYYRHLTVNVTQAPSVGVFQSTDPIMADSTAFTDGLTRLTTVDTLPEGKPLLVPILSDSTTRASLTSAQTLQFLGMTPSEPFLATISLARLGVMNTGTTVSPFLIFSTPDPEAASKEFLIAEPDLLKMVAPTFGIDLTDQTMEVDPGFESTYMYNLPVRTLQSMNLDTKEKTILLYYGYATDQTIIVATDPTVLKAVYDTIISQH